MVREKELNNEILKVIPKKLTYCLNCGRIWIRDNLYPEETTVEECWKCVMERHQFEYNPQKAKDIYITKNTSTISFLDENDNIDNRKLKLFHKARDNFFKEMKEIGFNIDILMVELKKG